ncbi:hypothetical protein BpHYR1_019710 [Brachionus plicatilis]|uniref:Lipocalin/cytosolic fatty-acid binding domain-containing protein n=1 Tax=Brachionus plicatilis TaxID=10195 RepID=A0A3M7PYT3_BRAPC|nr:hypothetical protein BpHYR1_019710 [Brachionus plicatilis]
MKRQISCFLVVLLSFYPCNCMNQACETNIRPSQGFNFNDINSKWHLIASTYTEKINRSCITVEFSKEKIESNGIKVTESSRNAAGESKEIVLIRKLDYNNEGIFEPEPGYFTVYDTLNRPSTKLLPGMGISLYIDEAIYIEYVHYDVVHAWYRECYKRVFIYHKTTLPHVFESIFPIIKKELNQVGVSLDSIVVKPYDRTCRTL